MTQISYISCTPLYSGVTTLSVLTPTVAIDDTLMLVLGCHDVGLTPIIDPHWYLVMNINGINGSSFVYLHDHITSSVFPAVVGISNISNKLNCSYILRFSGCTFNVSSLINDSIGIDNGSGHTGNNGFTTTKVNTMIIQLVTMFTNVTTSNWSSTPTLIWTEVLDNGVSYLSYSIHESAAVSSLAPKSTYTNFNYNLSGGTENISISIALTPRTTPNIVQNLLQSF